MSLLLAQMMRRRSVTGYRDLVRSLSPLAFWTGDNTGLDASGYGHDINIIVPTPPGTISYGAGKLDGALSFSGSQGYAAPFPAWTSDKICYMFGVYSSSAMAALHSIVAQTAADTSSVGPWFYTYFDQIGWKETGGFGLPFTTGFKLPINQWVHIVALAQANDVRVYLNGVLGKSATTGSVIGFPSVRVDIGYQSYQTGRGFHHGLVDELSIHDSIPTEAQIAEAARLFLAGHA